MVFRERDNGDQLMQPTVVPNFISKSTSDYIYKELKKDAILNPNGLLNVYLTERMTDRLSGVLNDMLFLIVESVANHLGFPKEKVKLNRVNYQILTQGQELGYHSDKNGAYGDTMDHDGYSALVYLTDSYAGGEIVFYDDNTGSKDNSTAYHPEAGTMVYFKGDDDHPHSVNKVLSGERANLILFFDVYQNGGNK